MRKIIIASHERMAEGIKNTLDYITKGIGNVHTLSAYLSNTPVKEEVKHLLEDVGEEDEVVVFTDMLGGSVNQAFAAYLDRPHFHIIAGINVPVIISVLVQPEDEYLTAEQILSAVEEARQQLVYVNDYVANMPKDDEEDE